MKISTPSTSPWNQKGSRLEWSCLHNTNPWRYCLHLVSWSQLPGLHSWVVCVGCLTCIGLNSYEASELPPVHPNPGSLSIEDVCWYQHSLRNHAPQRFSIHVFFACHSLLIALSGFLVAHCVTIAALHHVVPYFSRRLALARNGAISPVVLSFTQAHLWDTPSVTWRAIVSRDMKSIAAGLLSTVA